MGPFITEVKSTISFIVEEFIKVFNDFGLRVGFVGYRDYRKGQENAKELEKERLIEFPFSDDFKQFKFFLDGVKAYGGDDECEVYTIQSLNII